MSSVEQGVNLTGIQVAQALDGTWVCKVVYTEDQEGRSISTTRTKHVSLSAALRYALTTYGGTDGGN